MRAIETQKPEAERICNDPYARDLIGAGPSYYISKWIIDVGIYDRMAPGATTFIVGRERYIDDFLKSSLKEGLDQIVILGAGLDTRAYRIPGIEKTKVFEVDHPASQETKLTRLKKVIPSLPPHVTFIPIDFNTQSLAECLLKGGYDERGKTLFIWQGVVYFLTTEAVDNTLTFIADHSGPGSAVIFDYFYADVLRDPNRNDIKMMRRAARMTGEEYMFGIERGEAEAFLTQRGFTEVHDMPVENFKQLYLTGPNAKRTTPTGLGIVSAKVAR